MPKQDEKEKQEEQEITEQLKQQADAANDDKDNKKDTDKERMIGSGLFGGQSSSTNPENSGVTLPSANTSPTKGGAEQQKDHEDEKHKRDINEITNLNGKVKELREKNLALEEEKVNLESQLTSIGQ